MALAEPLEPIEGHISHARPRRGRAVIIDTDTGIDDAQALVLALRSEDVDVLAVTATHGNVAIGHVEGNICACLQATGRLEDVPVYLGAETPLVHMADEDASEWHGADGLGNTRLGQVAPRTCIKRDKPAAVAICDIASAYLQEHGTRVDVITIGPMSNLAIAVRLNPRLTAEVGTVYCMAGAERGHGNVGWPSITAEYNVFADPESAHVVLTSFPKVVMASWELTLRYGLGRAFLAKYLTRETAVGRFLSDVTAHLLAASGDEFLDQKGLMIPDPLAMAIALRPDVITGSARHSVVVETRGQFTRGMTVVDWRDASGRPRNVEVVDAIDFEKVKDMLLHSMRP